MQKKKKSTEINISVRQRVIRLLFAILLAMPLLYLSIGRQYLGGRLPFFLVDNNVGVGICKMLLSLLVMICCGNIFSSGLRSMAWGRAGLDTLAVISAGAPFGYSTICLLAASYENDTTAGGRDFTLSLCFEASAVVVIMISIAELVVAIEQDRSVAATGELLTLFEEETRNAIRDDMEFDEPAHIMKRCRIFEGVYSYLLVFAAIGTGCLMIYMGYGIRYSVTRGLCVLLCGVPAGLGIAAPIAFARAQRKAAESGILYKKNSAIDDSGKAEIIAFDKTGIITMGEARVTDVMPNEHIALDDLMAAAGMLEEKSDHVLAVAVMDHIRENHKYYPTSDTFQVLSGNGVRAFYEGSTFAVGKQSFIYEQLMDTEGEDDFVSFIRSWRVERFEREGKTPLFFIKDHMLLGMIVVEDVIRKEARDAIEHIKELGVHVVMLTGDNERTARSIGRLAGVEAVIAGILPAGKKKVIGRLSQAGNCIMVARGMKQVPMLAESNEGFLLGRNKEISEGPIDVIITSEKLSDIAPAIILPRALRRNIQQGIALGFIYNMIMLPLAGGLLGGFADITLTPVMAALAMGLFAIAEALCAMRVSLVRLDKPGRFNRGLMTIDYRQIIEQEADS